MLAPEVFWPTALGVCFLVAGLGTSRGAWRDARDENALTRFAVFGPALVASALAAFAGEHFTITKIIASLVPSFMPGRIFIAYLVGVAHLAAALSFVTRRYVRWSSALLALMFALFVVLMDVPGAMRHPAVRMGWSLAARETTFSLGALALFATVTYADSARRSTAIITGVRYWTAFVLAFYGIENIVFNQFSPGVPDLIAAPAWVPAPSLIACVTGALLLASGIAMLVERFAEKGAAVAGLVLTVLVATIYAPQWFIATDRLTALNFVFDTLLFAGMMLVVSRAIGVAQQNAPLIEVDQGRARTSAA